MERNNERITQLEQTGMELWCRAESWKNTIHQIEKLNRDPIIAQIIKRALNQENTNV